MSKELSKEFQKNLVDVVEEEFSWLKKELQKKGKITSANLDVALIVIRAFVKTHNR